MSALALRALRLRRGLRLTRVRIAVIALGMAILGGLGWLWLRDSPLVTVDRVTVTGASGPDAGAIRHALMSAARAMTTLDLNGDQLRTAVSPYPEVKALRVSTQLPHGVRIRVIEQLPVARVLLGARAEPVAADGTLLQSSSGAASLPTIALAVPPGGPRVTEPAALHALRLLGAAPYRMLSRVSQVISVPGHGLVAQLRNGPAIYFGESRELGAKWRAVMAVLADPGSAGASYIDTTDPARPAAGGNSPTLPPTATVATGAASASTSTTGSTSGG